MVSKVCPDPWEMVLINYHSVKRRLIPCQRGPLPPPWCWPASSRCPPPSLDRGSRHSPGYYRHVLSAGSYSWPAGHWAWIRRQPCPRPQAQGRRARLQKAGSHLPAPSRGDTGRMASCSRNPDQKAGELPLSTLGPRSIWDHSFPLASPLPFGPKRQHGDLGQPDTIVPRTPHRRRAVNGFKLQDFKRF